MTVQDRVVQAFLATIERARLVGAQPGQEVYLQWAAALTRALALWKKEAGRISDPEELVQNAIEATIVEDANLPPGPVLLGLDGGILPQWLFALSQVQGVPAPPPDRWPVSAPPTQPPAAIARWIALHWALETNPDRCSEVARAEFNRAASTLLCRDYEDAAHLVETAHQLLTPIGEKRQSAIILRWISNKQEPPQRAPSAPPRKPKAAGLPTSFPKAMPKKSPPKGFDPVALGEVVIRVLEQPTREKAIVAIAKAVIEQQKPKRKAPVRKRGGN